MLRPVFEEILSIFAETPEALFKIGNRAYEIGSEKLQKATYMKIAIEAYQNALKIFTEESYPMYNKGIADNLGNLINFCKMNDVKL